MEVINPATHEVWLASDRPLPPEHMEETLRALIKRHKGAEKAGLHALKIVVWHTHDHTSEERMRLEFSCKVRGKMVTMAVPDRGTGDPIGARVPGSGPKEWAVTAESLVNSALSTYGDLAGTKEGDELAMRRLADLQARFSGLGLR